MYYIRIAMSAPLYQFQWTLPDAGYEVIETSWTDEDRKAQESQAFLAERMDLANRKAWTYVPLEAETGLFKEFAALYPATDDKVVRFANRHGWLGVEHRRVSRIYPESRVPIGVFTWMFGEPLVTWQHQIERMHHLVRLWQAASDGDDSVLAEYIEWKSDPGTGRPTSVSYWEPTSGLGIIEPTQSFSLIASEIHRPELFGDFTRGDHVGPALHALQREINKTFEKHPANPRLLWDPDYKRMSLYLAPTTLLGALWLQFAQAIEGNKQYRQCEQCRRWFEVGAQVREDAKFCQSACRSKAYRERQKTARKLRSEGVPVREIARRLESHGKTVTRWIKT